MNAAFLHLDSFDAFDLILDYCSPRDLLFLRYVNKAYKRKVEKYYIEIRLKRETGKPFVKANIMCQSYNIDMTFECTSVHHGKMYFEAESPISLENLEYTSDIHIYISKLSHCFEENINEMYYIYMKKYMNSVENMHDKDETLLVSCEEEISGEIEIPYIEFPSHSIFYTYKYGGPVKNIYLFGFKLAISELTNMYIPVVPTTWACI